MNYAQIRELDISNGFGIGVSIFVQGCQFHCKNCFNKRTWDKDEGKYFDKETKDKFLKSIDRPYISRVSILGGEPLATYNIDEVISLAKEIKETYPDKEIWLWTGYSFEYIPNKDILNYIDYLVDGRYIDELRDLKLYFRGSKNQRLINVKETLKKDKIVLLEIEKER